MAETVDPRRHRHGSQFHAHPTDAATGATGHVHVNTNDDFEQEAVFHESRQFSLDPIPGGGFFDYKETGMTAETDRTKQIQAEVDELRRWWITRAGDDIEITGPKAVEYGAADLEVMGKAMEHLIPRGNDVNIDGVQGGRRQAGLEAAIAFYLLGKIARCYGAFEQGRRPSDDTLFDISIYAGMLRKVRETGKWV